MRSSHVLALGIAALAALAACSEPQSPTGLVASRRGPTATTQPGFYFLPPVAPAAVYSGMFDGSLAPVVEVRDVANALQARFTTGGSGANAVRVSLRDEHYIVNWQNRTGSAYTVVVLFDGQELGRAQLAPGRRTWPIKFRIEALPAPPPQYALQFGQSYVRVPDAPSLDLSQTWALEAWVNPTLAGNGTNQDIISKWGVGGNASYGMQLSPVGRVYVGTHDGNESRGMLGRTPLASGVWQHIAATFENGTLRIYINGVLDTSKAGFAAPMNSTSELAFGREGIYAAYMFGGVMDEVRIWNVVRSAAEIAAARTTRLTGHEAGLVGYWRFDEGVGDIASDATGFGNNGRFGAMVGPDAWDPRWTTNAAPIQ
jgi:hypothetical protein